MRHNFAAEAIPMGRARALVFGMAVVAAVLLLFGLQATGPAHASATFVVNSTSDLADSTTTDGVCFTNRFIVVGGSSVPECTLRAAIEQTNATAGMDAINFAIPDDPNVPGKEVKTISPNSGLVITDPVIIDGYTQPGSSVNTLAKGTNAILKIELKGTNAGATNGLSIGASNSVVRGLVINDVQAGRFVGHGISVCCASATGNKVEGNFIGTDPSGTQDKGNADSGIIVVGSNNTVGGTTPKKRNLISGNGGPGVVISGNPATDNQVEGNLIGTQRDGITALGNTEDGVFMGIYIGAKAMQNTVGDDDLSDGATNAANTIAFNGSDGVSVTGNDNIGNRILRNSIFSNTGRGINLGNGGRVLNDLGTPPDADTGPNNLQNYPEITSARPTTKQMGGHRRKFTTIRGNLVSTPSTIFTVQFFSSPLNEPNEGKKFIGQLTKVQTDANGVAVFNIRVARQKAPVGSAITATATKNSTGDTSEFSDPKSVG